MQRISGGSSETGMQALQAAEKGRERAARTPRRHVRGKQNLRRFSHLAAWRLGGSPPLGGFFNNLPVSRVCETGENWNRKIRKIWQWVGMGKTSSFLIFPIFL
jgi:hypothetical protein